MINFLSAIIFYLELIFSLTYIKERSNNSAHYNEKISLNKFFKDKK